MDVASQLDRVGHFVRWQAVARARGSVGLYNPRGQEAPEILEPRVVGASDGSTATTIMDLDELLRRWPNVPHRQRQEVTPIPDLQIVGAPDTIIAL